MFKLAIDTGGTFTDLVLWDSTSHVAIHHKVPAIPSAPWESVRQGITEILSLGKTTADQIYYFTHGTTIGVNAILQRKGAKAALVTTKGFKDILEIGRMELVNQFDIMTDKPLPLIDRKDVLEANERIASSGEVETELTETELSNVFNQLQQRGVETLAVSFINSYSNPVHEKLILDYARTKHPQIEVSISSQIWRETGEFERATLATLDAYIKPLMKKYLRILNENAKNIGVSVPVYLLTLNGGITEARVASERPVDTLLSGTAAGVMGAAFLSRLLELDETLSLDMGGTSTDVAYIQKGEPRYYNENSISGLPIVIPSLHVESVGAGGGSIAWVDPSGILKVGPVSAGADPGPACYGKGGKNATVTDAYLLCNYIDPNYFLGGRIKLNRELSISVMDKIASTLSKPRLEVAESILRVSSSTISKEIYALAAKIGFNPRNCWLITFGGAGPTHIPSLISEIEFKGVVVPPSPGTFSAMGGLVTDLKKDTIRSLREDITEVPKETFTKLFQEMEDELKEWLSKQGTMALSSYIQKSVDLRYQKQAYTIEINVDDFSNIDSAELIKRYHEAHKALYKHANPDAKIVVENLRARMIGRTSKLELVRLQGATSETPSPVSERQVYLDSSYQKAKVYRRSSLHPGQTFWGPAVVEQPDTTVLVPPDFRAISDDYNVLRITRG